MATFNEGTREIAEEIDARLRENPEFSRRLGEFGFIELEDTWGDETTILNTARVSTSNRRIRRVEDLNMGKLRSREFVNVERAPEGECCFPSPSVLSAFWEGDKQTWSLTSSPP